MDVKHHVYLLTLHRRSRPLSVSDTDPVFEAHSAKRGRSSQNKPAKMQTHTQKQQQNQNQTVINHEGEGQTKHVHVLIELKR